MASGKESRKVPEDLIQTISERLRANRRVRRSLPIWGRLHVDRQLPFLVVYRRPSDDTDEGTDRLALGEASYLLAAAHRSLQPSLVSLVRAVAETLGRAFGGFLILELWSMPSETVDSETETNSAPLFRIVTLKGSPLESTVRTLERALRRAKIQHLTPHVERVVSRKIGPPGLRALFTPDEATKLRVHLLGLEVRPVYRDPESGQVYPRVLRAMQRRLSAALKRGFFEFTRSHTTHLPPHYQALGRRAMVRAVWEVDGQLAEIGNAFDFLLYVTPANPDPAWRAFKKSKCETVPDFIYRPLPAEPALLKRSLYQIPIERVEDPVIFQLLSEKQDELDRKLTMLTDLGGPRFLYGSLQLFGGVDDSLVALAEDLLDRLPRRSRGNSGGGHVDASGFVKRAQKELDYYRRSYPKLSAAIQVRDDITGLMVSRGMLLVGKEVKIPRPRVEALIQHEVGTHLLTYLNGRTQPFKQLYSGLAGYEELQEGLAVFAEYMVGGLSRARMRLLAARVLAVHHLIEGAEFIETFRMLNRAHGFDQRTAFVITMRVYRGGGLTKDATYLRGLVRLSKYLKRGGAFEPLLIGKIAEDQVPVISELVWRGVLQPPPLRPRYLDDPNSYEKLQRLRAGVKIIDLVQKET